MNNIILTVIELVVLIIAFLFGKYAIPALKATLGVKNYEVLVSWVTTFVKAAEQTISKEGIKLGDKKYQTVLEAVQTKASELGVTISQEEISALIEEAVYTMNSEKKED